MRDLWQEHAANELKARIKGAELTHAEMAGKRTAKSAPMTTAALTKKLSLRAFSHALGSRPTASRKPDDAAGETASPRLGLVPQGQSAHSRRRNRNG